jgi:hypothetical protein
MSAIYDAITSIGSALGATGGSAAAYVWRRFRRAEKNAALGKSTAERAWSRLGELEESVRAFTAGVRFELDHLKSERAPMPSLPGATAGEIAQMNARMDDLSKELHHERNARRALQQEIVETAKEETRSWMEMQKTVARIDGAFEVVKSQLLTKRNL